MFEVLLDGIFGALAGVVAVLVAKRVVDPKAKPALHRIVLVFIVVTGFQTARMTLGPVVQSWKNSREVDAFLRDDKLFSRLLSDNPTLREPMRAALLEAYATGNRERATTAGRQLLSPVFPKYLPTASDEAILRFTRGTVYTLQTMAAQDTDRENPSEVGASFCRNWRRAATSISGFWQKHDRHSIRAHFPVEHGIGYMVKYASI
jgi:hypothetical protein